MAKLSKKSRHPEAPAPAVEPGPRLAQRRAAPRAGGSVVATHFAFLLLPSQSQLPRRQNGVAGKWRRNRLKSLNPRPEMVWSRKPRSHKIWYTAATADRALRLRAAGLPRLTNSTRKGNFAPRNPLKSLETGKESRSLEGRDSPTPYPAALRASTFRREGGRGSGRPVNTRPPTGSTCPRASGRRRR
jgi:hypothetical protein